MGVAAGMHCLQHSVHHHQHSMHHQRLTGSEHGLSCRCALRAVHRPGCSGTARTGRCVSHSAARSRPSGAGADTLGIALPSLLPHNASSMHELWLTTCWAACRCSTQQCNCKEHQRLGFSGAAGRTCWWTCRWCPPPSTPSVWRLHRAQSVSKDSGPLVAAITLSQP